MNESIAKILFKYANSFDLKDWQALEDTLMDTIECDYRDLRGTFETYSKEQYLQLRKQALSSLQTQHLFSNLEITAKKDHATCRLSAIIFRQNTEGRYFNSHVIYHFHLIQIKDGEWRIQKIKQNVLWNEGDPLVHKGVPR